MPKARFAHVYQARERERETSDRRLAPGRWDCRTPREACPMWRRSCVNRRSGTKRIARSGSARKAASWR
eukprot:scaffold362_cov246-Pinguiococcus_pyrenoidosus.AAC.10